MSDNPQPPETVLVGRIGKPHGIRGEVAVEVLSDVRARFAVGRELILRISEGEPRRLEIASSRRKGDLRIVRFAGFESRDEVERLRGAVLEIEPADVPRAPDGAYYHYELIGCSVHDGSAGHLGEVAAVIEDGGGWLLEIEQGSASLLMPFVAAYLQRVAIADRRIDVDLPAELIELCTSTS